LAAPMIPKRTVTVTASRVAARTKEPPADISPWLRSAGDTSGSRLGPLYDGSFLSRLVGNSGLRPARGRV
jgi:hypothetical protein